MVLDLPVVSGALQLNLNFISGKNELFVSYRTEQKYITFSITYLWSPLAFLHLSSYKDILLCYPSQFHQ